MRQASWKQRWWGAFGLGVVMVTAGWLARPAWGQSSGHGLDLRPVLGADQRPVAAAGHAGRTDVSIDPVSGCVVRVAYVIPSNRVPQADGVEKLRWAVRQCEAWFADQMERHGFPGRWPRFEREADGVTPRVYLVPVGVTDEYLRGDLWGRTINAASAAGVPVWTARQVWWLISEAHVQAPGGAISGGTALGASFGSGDDAGVGMLGGDALARFTMEYLTNNAGYANKIIPEIGPYPLVQNVSFPSFEGSTLSSVSSSILGAAVHELSHGFGLPHDFRNDKNFAGNLMGNGLRGIRGNFFPERYRSDYTRISYGAALALSVSRYFLPPTNYTDNTRPSVAVTTRGTNAPVDGLLRIQFGASDGGGLHAAWLQWNGDLVAEMTLLGTSTNATFATPYYNPNQNNTYTVSVFDRQGNKRTAETIVVPSPMGNRAPQPFVTLSSPTVFVGQNLALNAGESTDPGGNNAAMQVEWDFDGDGVWDTAPTPVKSVTRSFDAAGDRMVFARLTDGLGAQVVSAPLALRLVLPGLWVARQGTDIEVSWPSAAFGWSLRVADGPTPWVWQTNALPLGIRQDRFTVTLTNAVGGNGEGKWFRLAR